MSVVAIGSLRGSPGATTLALASVSVWERPGRAAVVVEADPDGGVLAARLGLGHHPCLTELAVRARSGARAELVWDAAQVRPGGGPVVVSHPSPDQCHATLRSGGTRLAEVLHALTDHDAIVDVGRLRPLSPAVPLVEAADVVLVVMRPRLDDVDTAVQRLPVLVDGPAMVGPRSRGRRAVPPGRHRGRPRRRPSWPSCPSTPAAPPPSPAPAPDRVPSTACRGCAASGAWPAAGALLDGQVDLPAVESR